MGILIKIIFLSIDIYEVSENELREEGWASKGCTAYQI